VKTVPCIRCGFELRHVFGDEEGNQPMRGLEFITQGHYGSTEFDPMDGTALAINVCDDCLRICRADGKVLSFDGRKYETWRR
jgi:hypothetical protein